MSNVNIIAPNIKSGGGKELLEYLLEYIAVNYKDLSVKVYLDDSLKEQLKYSNIEMIFLRTSWEKIKLFNEKIDHSLYFGNLPPLRKSSFSVVYLHNTYLLLPLYKLWKASLKFFLKYALQQLYLKFFIKNVDVVGCQTPMIKEHLDDKYHLRSVELFPFFRVPDKNYLCEKKYDFCYISLAHPHKNHQLLLDAIELLTNKGISVRLALTVETEKAELIERIKAINDKGIAKIDNFGIVPKDEVYDIYAKSRCLIFPSTEESFGLPLIEAVEMGLNVIAADLDYVYQVIEPSLVFDPQCVKSCANAMQSYLKEKPKKSNALVKNEIDKLIRRLLADD